MKYIDADKLIKSVNNYQEGAKAALNPIDGDADYYKGKIDACKDIQEFITSRQQEIWKPNEEQIMALRYVLNHIPYDSRKEEISGLLEQILKL